MIQNLILATLITFSVGSNLHEKKNLGWDLQINTQYRFVENPNINIYSYQNFNFISNNTLFNRMEVSNEYEAIGMANDNGWVYPYNEGHWQDTRYNTIIFKSLPNDQNLINWFKTNLTLNGVGYTNITQDNMNQIQYTTTQRIEARPNVGTNNFYKKTSNYQDTNFLIERAEYWYNTRWSYTEKDDMETRYASIFRIVNYTNLLTFDFTINEFHQTISNIDPNNIDNTGDYSDDFQVTFVEYSEAKMNILDSLMDYANYSTFPYSKLYEVVQNESNTDNDNYYLQQSQMTMPATTTLTANVRVTNNYNEYYFVVLNQCDNELGANYINRQILENSPQNKFTLSMSYEINNNTGNTGIKIEVIDLPSVMFTILGMPFTFISTAFNLTLFPNTPYQIDIGNAILGILTLLIVLFIMKIIIKKV